MITWTRAKKLNHVFGAILLGVLLIGCTGRYPGPLASSSPLPPQVTIETTKAPGPPPEPKWRIAGDLDRIVKIDGVDYLTSAPKKAESNGVEMQVLAITVNGDTAHAIVSIDQPDRSSGLGAANGRGTITLPEQVHLIGEDGQPKHSSQSIAVLAEFDDIALAMISFPLAGNPSRSLTLDVSQMRSVRANDQAGAAQNSAGAEQPVSGRWRIPLLIDNFPGEEQRPRSSLLSYEARQYAYANGAKILLGDGTQTPFGILVNNPKIDPRARDWGELWSFTLTSATGQPTMWYGSVKDDGSVQRLSKEEYHERLTATIFAPNPTPVVAPNAGPNPRNFPTSIPNHPTDVSRPMQDVIKEHLKDLTPTP